MPAACGLKLHPRLGSLLQRARSGVSGVGKDGKLVPEDAKTALDCKNETQQEDHVRPHDPDHRWNSPHGPFYGEAFD